jgi:hypothetical protein
MSDSEILSRTQVINVESPEDKEVSVVYRTQRLIVDSPTSTRVVSAGPVGPRGVPGQDGTDGEQGPPGQSAEGLISYRHVQSSPSSHWEIVHNLGYKPGGVFVTDSAGTQHTGKVTHIDATTLTIDFTVNGQPAEFSGEAELS